METEWKLEEVDELLADIAMLLTRYPSGPTHDHLVATADHLRKDRDYAQGMKDVLEKVRSQRDG